MEAPQERDRPCHSAVVIIATHGRASLLERSLRSLEDCDAPGVPVEVLVVENGGPTRSRDLCETIQYRYPLRYAFLPEPGKSRALNLALETSAADLAIFFDDDVRLDRGTLRAFVEGANRYGRHHFFGGAVEVDYETPPPDWLRVHLPASARGWDLGKEQAVAKTEFLGANWAAFRDELVAAGGFPLEFGPSHGIRAVGEETEMQRRLEARSSSGIFIPSARVWHFVPGDRSTREWALDRRHRLRFTATLNNSGRAARWGTVPLWLWRQYAWHLGKVALARAFRFSPDRRIAIEMKLAEDRGAIAGHRERARRARRARKRQPPVPSTA